MAIEDDPDIGEFRPTLQPFESRFHLEKVSVGQEEPVSFDGHKKFPRGDAARVAIAGDAQDRYFERYPDKDGIVVIVSKVNQRGEIGVS